MRPSTRRRSANGVRAQLACAARARATMANTSSGDCTGASPSGSPVAGFQQGIVVAQRPAFFFAVASVHFGSGRRSFEVHRMLQSDRATPARALTFVVTPRP